MILLYVKLCVIEVCIVMFRKKRSVQKIHNLSNSKTQEFSDTSLDSGTVLLDIPISYPATPLDGSYQSPAISLNAIEEKIFQQQQDNDNGSRDSLSLKLEESAWMQSFWELENKHLQLYDLYKNVLQENLRIQNENIRLKQELEFSWKNAEDLEVRLHGFQSGASIFQDQYFMLQKQNIQLAKKLYELQSTLTNVSFTQIDSTQKHDPIPKSEEHQQNPQMVCAYENFKNGRRRHSDGSKSNSTVIVPHQREPYQQQHAAYKDPLVQHAPSKQQPPPYKDPPVQHVPSQQQRVPYEFFPYQYVPSQQQHVPREVFTYQHDPYRDPLPQHALYECIEETSVIVADSVKAASSSKNLELWFCRNK